MYFFNRTYSDVPADPPQNVTLEAASSKSLIVRWEPPPPESQNGIITGYKLRWRKKGGEPEVVTTDGSRRLFAVTGLKNGKEYQVENRALINFRARATSTAQARAAARLTRTALPRMLL